MKLPEFWKTGLLFVAAAGLGSWIWFVERKQEIRPEGEREKVTILAVDKAKAKSLTLAAAAGTIELEKAGESWQVKAPFAAPADQPAVESLLSSLEKLEADELVTDQPEDLSQYGLATPSRTVTVVVDGAAEPLAVQFGAKSPDGANVYAKTLASPSVYLVASWIESGFDKKPFDLRDRDLLHVARDQVRSIEVLGPEGAYALARTDAGDWAFTRPLATRAGRWSVDGLLGTIENLRMESVAAEGAAEANQLARFGLVSPARTVTLVLADGSTRTLQIGAAAPDPAAAATPPTPAPGADPSRPTRYFAREAKGSLVAVVPATLADDLAKGMAELRAKRLLEIATYETEGFEVAANGKKQIYAKTTSKDQDGFEKSQWKRTAPDAKDLDTAKVEDALFKMGGVEAAEFLDAPQAPAAYGLDQPRLRVSVKGKGELWLELGQKDGAYFARRSNDASILKLDAAKAEELLKAFSEL